MAIDISDVLRRVVYAPNGVGPYQFTFEILTQTDIDVYRGSTLLTLTTDYTVSINIDGTGSVTLVSTAGTSNITIVGARGIARSTDFVTGGDLLANSLNDELDAQTIFAQQTYELASRGLKAPVYDPTDINMTLPAKASRAGKVLSFDSTTGDPLASITANEVANAQTYATNAANSATAAASSASSASSSASSASSSASTASTAATNASNSASSASTSASNASTSASNAATSETNAASSASSASTSASSASTSASNASTSASNAASAQSAAEAARDQTLASFDSFDDRYLGAKTSDPTLDNDGNALVAGALYFNSTSGVMKVYTGSVWVAAYVSGTDFLAKANNLSDLPSTSTARTNLGLGTGDSPQFTALNVGNASDTTVTRASAGVIAVEGSNVLLASNIGASVQAYSSELQGISQGGINGMKNRIINGAMVIDQRNNGAAVSPAVDGTYYLDRWRASLTASGKFSIQQNAGSVTPPAGFTNYLGITSLSAYSIVAGDIFMVTQRIEGYNVADFAWGSANASTVTFSFWVRSSLTGTFGGSLANGTGRSYPFSYTINAANTWEQKTVTVTGDTSGTWLTTNGIGLICAFGLGVGSTFSGTAGAWTGSTLYSATGATSVVGTNGATFYITGVQLEKGSTATSFDYRPYGTELALCQRYAQPCGQGGTGRASSSTGLETTTQFRVPMRATPTISFGGFSGAQTEISQFGVGSITVSAVSNSGFASATGSYLSYTTTGATTGSFCACIKGDTSFANAEL